MSKNKKGAVDRETFFPKEVTGVLPPGRILAQVSVEAQIMPEPGVLARTASIIADMNIRILSLSFTSRGDKRYITALIDLTESNVTVKDLVEKLKQQEYAIQVKYSVAEPPGLLVDKHCFPLETVGGEIRALLIPVKTLSGIFANLREKHGTGIWALAYHQGRILGGG